MVRGSGDIDVHMVSHPLGGRGIERTRKRDLGRVRVAVGFAMALVVPVLLQLLLAVAPSHNIATAVLIQLTGSVAVALIGGLWPALLGALWSSFLVNYFSIPPLGTLTINDPQNLLALLVFAGVSSAVAVVVDLSARRSKEAARARSEAATLGDLTRGASTAEDPVQGSLGTGIGRLPGSHRCLVPRCGEDPALLILPFLGRRRWWQRRRRRRRRRLAAGGIGRQPTG